MGLTVAGTVPDSHRIPFYILAESQNITILVAKVVQMSGKTKFIWIFPECSLPSRLEKT